MAKKVATTKKKKTQKEEDAEFIKLLKSDAGTKLLGDEKAMRKIMKKADKFYGF